MVAVELKCVVEVMGGSGWRLPRSEATKPERHGAKSQPLSSLLGLHLWKDHIEGET